MKLCEIFSALLVDFSHIRKGSDKFPAHEVAGGSLLLLTVDKLL